MSQLRLHVCTYNIRGFNSTKVKYINDVLKFSSILFLEELWLSDKQISELSTYFPGYDVHGVSAIDSTILLRGRPKGGIAVIYPDSFGSKLSFIKTESKRLCSISLKIDQLLIYFFCAYMPWDCNEVNNCNEFQSILNEISALCITNNVEHMCVLGDMNTDFSRTHSWHTQALNRFIDHENLYNALQHSSSNVSYSYSNSYSQCYSILDHIFLSKSLSHYIVNYYSKCDEVENQSDHAPIVLELDIPIDHHIHVPINYKPRKKWNIASNDQIGNYKLALDNSLTQIVMPDDCLECTSMLCDSSKHALDIQQLHDDIISACINASEDIPSTGKSSKNVPGWNKFVRPEKEKAILWQKIWISNGSPRHGYVADIMRRTRAKYHYVIRRTKNNNQLLKNRAMARAIAQRKSRELWTEVNKIKSSKTHATNCMDNVNGSEQIVKIFSDKYCELYNSVGYGNLQLANIISDNTVDVIMYCMNEHNPTCTVNESITHTHSVTPDMVQSAINKIKPGKSDCTDGMLSDNLMNGTLKLNMFISELFSAMLIHGVAPGGLLLSTLVPIPKNKRGSKTDSNNYRAIAISSLLGKLFDLIVLSEQAPCLKTDSLQFRFKKCSSTVTCTALLMETIEYYNENGSDCYLLLLDASKAFDRVEYVNLFNTLRDRNLCPIVLRIIMNMYVNQVIQIK